MEKQVGKITHYYGHLGVAAVALEDELRVGDTIHIKGHTSDWTQKVDQLQYEHQNVDRAVSGQVVGIRTIDHAREHDIVYLVE
jgi:putative protease